ncbi:hypothetical protein BOW50_11365 [Solemya velum gill symbiont]|uniref:ankyrin repeat domain-containing protein n=1 Tax=Solemya velum gill symbiont TaxID=2340 RepID=UPI0009972A18|nr:ankyrin repeat domain-containing protein [Solemya velum gill symbiont]OOZ75525.1 hypothetical protein BOW50_11365 [Solemya velum gill symbiont]
MDVLNTINTFGLAFLGVIIGLAAAWLSYKVIKPKELEKTISYGRLWAAWAVALVTLIAIPRSIMQQEINFVVQWLIGLVAFGLGAFIVGLFHGSLRSKSSEIRSESKRKTINESAQIMPASNHEADLRTSVNEKLDGLAMPEIDNDKLYAKAWDEIEDETYDKGMWAKAYAMNNGEREQTIAAYIRERVHQLITEEQAKLRIEGGELRSSEIAEKREAYKALYSDYLERHPDEMPSDINYVYPSGETGLHLAVANRDYYDVRKYLAFGADPTIQDKQGRTALDYAKELKAKEVIRILEFADQHWPR